MADEPSSIDGAGHGGLDASIVEKLAAGAKAAAAETRAIVWLGVEAHGIEVRATRRGDHTKHVTIQLLLWEQIIAGDRPVERTIPYVVDALERAIGATGGK